MQLDKRLESVQNKEISAVSIIRSHRQAASVVANLVGLVIGLHSLVWLFR